MAGQKLGFADGVCWCASLVGFGLGLASILPVGVLRVLMIAGYAIALVGGGWYEFILVAFDIELNRRVELFFLWLILLFILMPMWRCILGKPPLW